MSAIVSSSSFVEVKSVKSVKEVAKVMLIHLTLLSTILSSQSLSHSNNPWHKAATKYSVYVLRMLDNPKYKQINVTTTTINQNNNNNNNNNKKNKKSNETRWQHDDNKRAPPDPNTIKLEFLTKLEKVIKDGQKILQRYVLPLLRQNRNTHVYATAMAAIVRVVDQATKGRDLIEKNCMYDHETRREGDKGEEEGEEGEEGEVDNSEEDAIDDIFGKAEEGPSRDDYGSDLGRASSGDDEARKKTKAEAKNKKEKKEKKEKKRRKKKDAIDAIFS